MSLIEKFLGGSFEEELAECNKMIEQQADVLRWTVTNNVPPSTQANHQAKLEILQSQKRQLIRCQEELFLTEALLNSILRQ